MNPIIFWHIDKTGGMSLRHFLASQFDRGAIMPVAHHPDATYQDVNYPIVDMTLLQAHHFFEVMYEPANHRLIMGHWDTSILKHIHITPITITVLRHPADRYLSLYRYICQEKGQYGHLSDSARRLGALVFAMRYQSLYAESMCKQLAGYRWARVDNQTFASYIGERAMARLNQMDYVATIKQLPQLIERLMADFGWSIHSIPHINKTTYPLPEGFDDTVLHRFIAQTCPNDLALYKKAQELGGALCQTTAKS